MVAVVRKRQIVEKQRRRTLYEVSAWKNVPFAAASRIHASAAPPCRLSPPPTSRPSTLSPFNHQKQVLYMSQPE